MKPEARPNPLSNAAGASQPEHPMLSHARVWQHVGTMGPEAIKSKVGELDYALPILGALAGKENLKAKDVIKAAADAAGAGKIEPSQAVSIISQMPTDPEKLRPWLKGLYAANMSAQVHMKAALMPDATAAPSAPVVQQ